MKSRLRSRCRAIDASSTSITAAAAGQSWTMLERLCCPTPHQANPTCRLCASHCMTISSLLWAPARRRNNGRSLASVLWDINHNRLSPSTRGERGRIDEERFTIEGAAMRLMDVPIHHQSGPPPLHPREQLWRESLYFPSPPHRFITRDL